MVFCQAQRGLIEPDISSIIGLMNIQRMILYDICIVLYLAYRKMEIIWTYVCLYVCPLMSLIRGHIYLTDLHFDETYQSR